MTLDVIEILQVAKYKYPLVICGGAKSKADMQVVRSDSMQNARHKWRAGIEVSMMRLPQGQHRNKRVAERDVFLKPLLRHLEHAQAGLRS